MNRWISICVLIAHSTSVFSAVAEKEYEQLSIDLVTNFLSRVDKPEPFTFREECEFFGELSLMGAFLYRQDFRGDSPRRFFATAFHAAYYTTKRHSARTFENIFEVFKNTLDGREWNVLSFGHNQGGIV